MPTAYIFESFTIEDSDGSNPITYHLIDVENTKVNVDFDANVVDTSQLLRATRVVDFSIMSYDENLVSDTRLMQDGSVIKPKAKLILNPADGGMGIIFNDIRLILKRSLTNATCFYITAKKRAVVEANIVDVWGTSSQVFGTSEFVWSLSYTQGNFLEII
jgi:hypothetical protein